MQKTELKARKTPETDTVHHQASDLIPQIFSIHFLCLNGSGIHIYLYLYTYIHNVFTYIGTERNVTKL